jgi:hypothetical protein
VVVPVNFSRLEQDVLSTSRSHQGCLPCHLFRHHPCPDGIPLLTWHRLALRTKSINAYSLAIGLSAVMRLGFERALSTAEYPQPFSSDQLPFRYEHQRKS